MLIEKMVAYCDRIDDNLKRYNDDYAAFLADPMFQDACCMCIVQLGELASALSEGVKAGNPAVPWRLIKDTRNFYVHAYGAVDLACVWATLKSDIPV